MPDLPAMLSIRGWRCVVIGGGGVATRRAKALLDASASVTVIAPIVTDELHTTHAAILQRPYRAGDLASARLVVIATDDACTNDAAAQEARGVGALVNRADNPDASDLHFMAQAQLGPVTLAVHTGNVSASAAAAIRDELAAALDPDWPRLLEAAAPCRARLQAAIADPAARQTALRRLTDPQTMAILKEHGPEALRHYLDRLLADAESPPP